MGALQLLPWLVLSPACARASLACQPQGLAVDGHRVRHAMAAALNPVFSWQLPAAPAPPPGTAEGSGACARQIAFQVQIVQARVVLFDTGRVNSSVSDGVRVRSLAAAREYAWRVRVWAAGEGHGRAGGGGGGRGPATATAPLAPSAWSAPNAFATRMAASSLAAVLPLWAPAPHATAAAPSRFALLRGAFNLTGPPQPPSMFLALSAKPSPNWKATAPRGNASKLLGAYKAWVNGVPLGVGPGRTYAAGVGVDVFNVTELLHAGVGNVLAIQAFYQPLGFPGKGNNSDDAGGVWAALYSGDGDGGLLFSTGAAHLAQWSALEGADEAFGIGAAPGCTSKMCAGDCAQRYFQPAENIDMRLYPDGWQLPGAAAAAWRGGRGPPSPTPVPRVHPAVQRAAGAFSDGLAVKGPMPLTLRRQLALRFLLVEEATDSSGLRSWSYIVDWGCNFQGGLNMSFAATASTEGYVRAPNDDRMGPSFLTLPALPRARTESAHIRTQG